MKFVYFDCSSGASGDMILGALLSLGVPLDEFRQAIKGLKIAVDIKTRKANSHNLTGLKVEVLTPDTSPERDFSAVEKIILKSSFSSEVKKKASQVFKKLFEAEARVHGRSFQKTHLHEAAADDALVDIVGTCWLLERLKVSKLFFSPVNLGSGFAQSSHGQLAVPPPAVAELMRGYPVFRTEEPTELLTPTGAAILTTLGEFLRQWPELVYNKIGYGLGHKKLTFHPNILRAFYGDLKFFQPAKKIQVIEATLDDASPQLLGNFLNQALKLGALEAYLTPVIMKKNRPGIKLTILAEIDKIDQLIEAIFQETTTIGLRYYPVERRILRRETEEYNLQGQRIRVKVSYLGDKPVNFQPEFDDCLRAAEKLRLPVKKVINLVIKKLPG